MTSIFGHPGHIVWLRIHRYIGTDAMMEGAISEI